MSAFTDFEQFLQGQRNRLAVADVDAVSRGRHNFSGLAAETRAGIYVWTAAALEAFLPAFIWESIDTINADGLANGDLRFSLFAILCDRHFHTIRSAEVRSAWQSRMQLLSDLSSSAIVPLPHAGPIDGKTIRSFHFEAMWAVFGLPGDPWPSAFSSSILEDLANSRNDVAHGTVSPVQFGRGRTFADCGRMLDRIEELVFHTVLTMDNYLQADGYRR
jgi:hypothetical protein